jgi:hypothetical protein
MTTDKHRKLVSLLLSQTRRGKVDWKESVNGGAFQVSFANNSLRISEHETERSIDYVIELINNEGVVVESFADPELETDQNQVWFRDMKELYETARRTVLGSEKVLNEIINELEDDLPF